MGPEDVDARHKAGHDAPLTEFAPAKINLTLRVLGRRADGYHELDSLVAFARAGDRLTLVPGDTTGLQLRGPHADATGALGDNLVIKAARHLAGSVPHLRSGKFTLDKRLPVAAGLGGGSADAAAALRLLARANGLAADDPRLFAAARESGADVPVCLQARARVMRGIGDVLSPPLDLPGLPALLVNPGVAVPTKDVFAALGLAPSADLRPPDKADVPRRRGDLIRFLQDRSNDLERPAITVQPIIAEVLQALRLTPACRLARMSGSGATCFALFDSQRAASVAARTLKASRPAWWVAATVLG
jgi:4-diphosphocytidyl-2-C-methyl-D-erythritol kinase